MDLDGDGLRDVVSGSWPGQIFIFRGLAGGGFHGREELLDVGGAPVKVGAASSVTVTDWDRDGDLDLLVGEYYGRLFFLPGEGELRFGEAVAIAEFSGSGQGHAAPHVADWDDDGTEDLLVGLGDSSVLLFRGSERQGVSGLGAPVTLVSGVRNGAVQKMRGRPGEVFLRPGGYAKVCTWDWNDDGRLDLLVGDRATELGPQPKLTPNDALAVVWLEGVIRHLRKKEQAIRDVARATARREIGVDRWSATAKQKERLLARISELCREEVEHRELSASIADLSEIIVMYQAPLLRHGYVWVYLRATRGPP